MLARAFAVLTLLAGFAAVWIASSVIGATPLVNAEPKQPHVFFGRIVDAGDSLIAANITIQARVDNVHYAQSVVSGNSSLSTKTHSEDSQGRNFGTDSNFQVCADDSSTSDVEGGNANEPITFYVNGVLATITLNGTEMDTIPFEVGGVDEITLTIPSTLAAKAASATSSTSACTTESGEVDDDDTPTGTGGGGTGTGGGGTGGGGTGGTGGGGVVTPKEKVDVIEQAEDVDTSDPTEARDFVNNLDSNELVEVFEAVDSETGADILESVRASQVAEIIDSIDESKAAGIVGELSASKAAAVLENLDEEKAAALIEEIPTGKAAEIVGNLGVQTAVGIIEKVDLQKAAEIMGELTVGRAVRIFAQVSPKKAGKLFDESTRQRMVDIIDAMAEGDLVDSLQHMKASKMFDLPPVALFNKLRNVPVEHIAKEKPPKHDPDKSKLSVNQESEKRTRYGVGRTQKGGWSMMVGSPPYIDQVLGKFNREITGVEVLVEELDGMPSDLPSLDSGIVVNEVLQVTVDEASANDISAIRMGFRVSQDWIETFGIHKWSIDIYRYNESSNAWDRFPAKRIEENDESVSYVVALPGFSLLAITGSADVRAPQFSVADLAISPQLAVAGETVTISARVRNDSNGTLVFPANLWLDDTLEEVKAISFQGGETRTVSFEVVQQEGDYSVRIVRLLGEFSVGAQPPQPVVTTVPTGPTATSTPVPDPTATPEPVDTPTPQVVVQVPTVVQPTATPYIIIATATAGPPTAVPPPSPTAVVVAQVPTPTSTPIITDEETKDGGLGMGAIIGILIGVIVVLGGIAGYMFMVMKKRE